MRTGRAKARGGMAVALVLALSLVGCASETKAPMGDTAADQGGADAVEVAADVSQAAIDPCAVDPELANPPTPTAATPRWAFEPWISKDISTSDDTRAFVKGFVDRGIPVGVVVLDSPWETNYHTFQANPKRYPGFKELVGELHGQNIKLVVWLTQMVNQASFDLEAGGDLYDGPSPNLGEGLKCGHFVNGGELSTWWKGKGAGLDFFSPAARTWWNRQQIELLQLVDGYKLDFGEMYIASVPMQTAAGSQGLDAYSQAYYREMLAFGLARNPEFVTMVRPWDESYDFAGRFFAKPQHAPVAWVGDNRRDWVGLVDALDHIFRSAQAGYTMLGSDIGGYLDRDDKDLTKKIPFDAKVFARWTALGALGPFMQLHGRANLTPWTTPDHTQELLDMYAYWAHWHHQLAPMLYSVVHRSQTQPGQPLVLQPVAAADKWAGDWRYLLGGLWLVAPLTDGTDQRTVQLPAGQTWLSWWKLAAAPLAGDTTVTADFSNDFRGIPLYVAACSVQPFADGNALTGLAPAGLTPHDGWLVLAAAEGERSFTLEGKAPVTAQLQVKQGVVTLSLSGRPRATVVTVRAPGQVKAVLVDGKPQATASVSDGKLLGYQVDAKSGLVWIGLPAGGAAQLTIQ
ncbi:MAG: hypothetical protein HY902_14060 [Deltaproteobacteria bacterium]|nr:hypothetical protein [Deltaproteobacteria bacterium]